jgi:[protein-PII] uridylyltransferase
MRYPKPIITEASSVETIPALIKHYKAFLKVEEARILLRHRQSEEGLRICQERTDLIDHVVRCLWKDLPLRLDPPVKTLPAIALVATGGYARGVMNRHSDIDLSYILSGNRLDLSPEVAGLIGQFNLCLGDLGFEVGHATDCVGGRLAQANADNLTKTSLITTRFITGDPQPYSELQARFVPECIAKQEDKFLLRQLEELSNRHTKQESTPFVQQPNVKEGCGGLRDYQNLVWVSFAKLRITDLSELVGAEMLDKRGWNELRRAYDFLLRVRNEMHWHERREQDVLSLKLQGPIATKLGYTGTRMIDRIEAFMHDYYLHVRNVLRQSSKLMDRYNLLFLHQGEDRSLVRKLFTKIKPGKKPKVERFDGFYAEHGRIFPEHDRVIKEDPHRLMRLFMITQQRNLRLAPDLYDQVCNTSLVNAEFQYSKAVRETFLGILEHKGDVARVLRQMHRADFLGKYIPEFGALTCRVQHEFFHSYTADEHTLRCIDHLDELAGSEQKGMEFYQQLFRNNHDPAILYLALILHDTGRAANAKTHADQSTILADKLCRRLQIKGERRNQLLFLVDNHLLMYFTATKKNPDDPEVVQQFAEIVRTVENLQTLLVMTYADSKGVAGTGWNGFKDAALRELYHNTVRYLAAPADFMARATVPLDDLKAKVIAELSKGYAKDIDDHFERMPRAYFNFRKPSTIANHLRQFRAFRETCAKLDDPKSALPIMRWEDKPSEGCSKLMVVGWDRRLLLARVAGALAAESLSIIAADFYQRSDSTVLDVFRVSTANFEPVTGENTRKRVEKAVHDALGRSDFDFSAKIQSRRKIAAMAELEAEVPQWAYINNRVSPEHTVIELQALDRVGLLYDLFMVIGKQGYNITHARIGTERGIAVDAIYLQDLEGQKIIEPERFMPLKEALEKSVLQLG